MYEAPGIAHVMEIWDTHQSGHQRMGKMNRYTSLGYAKD